MCMGGSSNAGDTARALQQQQQGNINLGMEQLNRIFGGGTIGSGLLDPTAGFDPSKTYYSGIGQALTGDAAKTALDQGQLYTGTTATPGFTQDFYNQRAKDYQNFAMPELSRQFQQTQRGLNFRLAGAGLQHSGAAVQQQASLAQELARQQGGVVDQGVAQAQALQGQVAQQKNALVSQLAATGNPAGTAQSALGTAASFASPSVFAPVGNFFNNWASLYGANQQAQGLAGGLNNSTLLSLLSRGGGGTAPIPTVGYTH